MKRKFTRKGLTLAQVLVMTLVFLMFSTMKVGEIENRMIKEKSENAASQIKNIANATNSFISINYSKLIKLDANGFNQMACVNADNTCTLTQKTLIQQNLLPNSNTNKNILDKDIKIVIKREGAPPNYKINGLVYFEKEKYSKSRLLDELILNDLGVESGISNKNGMIQSLGGFWKIPLANYNIKTSEQIVAMKVGFDTSQYSVYLRRDGSLPMTGDLNLGAKNINNVANANASNNSTTNITRAEKADIDDINSSALVNNGTLKLSGKNTLSGKTDINKNYLTVNALSTFEKKVSFNDIVAVDKSATFKDQVTFKNTINAEGVSADMGNVNIANGFNVKGKKAGLENTLSVNNSGKVTQFDVGGNVKTANIDGSLFAATSTVKLGAVCNIKGSISKDEIGSVLMCESGKWTAIKAASEFYITRNRRGCDVKNKVTGSCSCSSGLQPYMITSRSWESCSGGGNNETCNSHTQSTYICN